MSTPLFAPAPNSTFLPHYATTQLDRHDPDSQPHTLEPISPSPSPSSASSSSPPSSAFTSSSSPLFGTSSSEGHTGTHSSGSGRQLSKGREFVPQERHPRDVSFDRVSASSSHSSSSFISSSHDRATADPSSRGTPVDGGGESPATYAPPRASSMSVDVPTTSRSSSSSLHAPSQNHHQPPHHDDSAPLALAGLSVQETEPRTSSSSTATAKQLAPIPGAAGSSASWTSSAAPSTSAAPPPKTRRASTLSSGSSSAHLTWNDDAVPSATSSSSSKASRDPTRPARRKAARMGSFETGVSASGGGQGYQSGGHAENDDESAIDDDGDAADTEADPVGDDQRMHIEDSDQRNSFSAPTAPPISNVDGDQTMASDVPPAVEPHRHVDIVNYPSADLLRLLASLLDQIARANDALHQRNASASAASSQSSSGRNTPGGARRNGNEDDAETLQAFQAGRFDAAPLNSPVTPRYRRGVPEDEDDDDDSSAGPSGAATPAEEMPVTPGVDLLREVGAGGGVEGFMPSLGGTHAPIPLSRRRGSSFLKKQYEDPRANIRSSSNAGAPSSTAPSQGTSRTASASSSSVPVKPPSPKPAEPPSTSLLTASSNALSSPSATLCFHARNIPAISIEAYLLRILKYCPTTNEVFLSLLVYFDRMARVGLEAQRLGLQPGPAGPGASIGGRGGPAPPESRPFAIDSFNVHRLVIAGVTVASKFFSDVFYTNSRYAKVGGLPLQELNQLELQFLLLNDFRLVIPVDELQRYADQLVLFWVGRNGSAPSAATPALVPSPAPPLATPSRPEVQQAGPAPSPTASRAPASTEGNAAFVPPGRPTPTHRSYSGMHQQLTSHAVASVNSGSAGGAIGTTSESTPRSMPIHHWSQQTHPPQATRTSSYSSSTPNPRPGSIRSQPSSSGTSVASTITPGTPSTERQSSEGGDFDSNDQVGGVESSSSDDEVSRRHREQMYEHHYRHSDEEGDEDDEGNHEDDEGNHEDDEGGDQATDAEGEKAVAGGGSGLRKKKKGSKKVRGPWRTFVPGFSNRGLGVDSDDDDKSVVGASDKGEGDDDRMQE
ncbi:BZ3500_MvSof-1268-A1-R1_Chr8-2g10190 [Microbotryum saponariae]|uniref:BZ3500_MvSof-1268-A1-R1_Chr8-2g10190 protein n=1 Tax=Microbotryum saponariae TaxID=289078 RepID=A0A2X0LJY3_9BASI|nr:BZ3500_MvSof-1268-A1-R1_Chr8-2g10190 [Microbotryum saponariae]SDA01967.1 BZ3501_MvSof-1269-A2-R1_Chr8-2g09940 [Microbotryum saponariae]